MPYPRYGIRGGGFCSLLLSGDERQHWRDVVAGHRITKLPLSLIESTRAILDAMATSRRKLKKPNVQKFRSDRPEARDEGPRALPLDAGRKSQELLWGRRALDLADIALGTKPPTPLKKKKIG